ncbi:hypothetical protein POHY109586_24440 [Polaromonas hydrogenivorans]
MQFVLHRPVAADRLGNGLCARAQGQTADVVVGLVAGFACHLARAPHHGDGLQVRPVFGGALEVLGHRHEPVFAALNAPVVVGTGAFPIVAVRWPDLLAGVASLKPGRNSPVQVAVVALEVEHVVRFTVHDGFGDGLLTPHGVNGDDAALDAQQLEQLGNGGDFVGLFVRLHLPQQHAGLARPGAHDMQRRLSAMARAAHALAINGHHALDLAGNALQPVDAYFLQRLRVNELEHPAKRVVRGNAIGQLQKRGEPFLLCLAKLHHVNPVIGPADNRAQRNHQNVHQFMAPCALDARIGHLPQVLHQACPGALRHQQFRLPKSHDYSFLPLCAWLLQFLLSI